jgi:hypothetical protein
MLPVLGSSTQALRTTITRVAEQHSGSKNDTTDRQKTLSTHTRVREVVAAESIVLTHARSDTTKKKTVDLNTGI